MQYFSVFLLIGFVALAVFGFSGMHAGMQDHDGECIAATAQKADCPTPSSLLNYLVFHIDAFKGFSTVILGGSLLVSLFTLLLLLIAGAGLGALLDKKAPPQPNLAYSRSRSSGSSYSPHKHELIRWLALHENSPAIF